MPVSLTGTSGRGLRKLTTAASVALVALLLAFYVYGPPSASLLRSAAATKCNDVTGGSFRNYALQWQVGWRPHWDCFDLRDAGSEPVNLGWWVSLS